MANPIEYIVFEPDQVLTNDHLNETFNYLDQQNRWTRNKLIGIGIVCGLEIVLKTGVIEITKGCGVTSQGYLIVQDTTDYTYYIPYTPVAVPPDLPFTHGPNLPFFSPFCQGKSVWQLITDAQYQALESAQQLQAVTISSATSFLTDYVVVLFLEANETGLINCNMLDCNNAGATMAFTIRPLLVQISDLPAVTAGSTGNTQTIPITNLNIPQTPVLKRYNVPYAGLTDTNDVLNAFVNLVDDATLTLISNAYTFAWEKYGGILSVTTNPFTSLLSNLQSYRNLILTKNPVFIQYFYDLLDDMIKAYHEFLSMTSEMEGTCCPDENLFPLHLILGAASAATSVYTADPYRNYFIYSALFSKMGDDSAGAALLFNRMVIIASSFTVPSTASLLQSTIIATPSQYEHFPLSQRAIPYYYTLNTSGAELYKYWNYYKTSQGNAASNLSYNANLYSSAAPIVTPLLYDIERFNFFRIEGHIGQQQNTALSNIQNLVSTYNLPFDVVAVSADQLSSGASLPQCSMNDLNVDYNLIIAEASCKIHITFCFVTKLPYETVANTKTGTTYYAMLNVPQPKVQQFSAFKLNQETILPAAAVLTDVYKKGDFMNTYCPSVANTVGSGYLAALSSTGVFTNPVTIDQGNPLTVFYYYLFEYVDAVESLMYELNTNTLATIDMTSFNTIYARYIGATLLLITLLTDATAVADQDAAGTGNAQFISLVEDLQLALLIDELTLLTTICIDDRLQVLVTEYNNRLSNYQQQLNFLTYFKNHTGLEHKAGVPKGGTFVLVYRSGSTDSDISTAAATTTGNSASASVIASSRVTSARSVDISAQQQTAANEYQISDSDLKAISSFVSDCSSASLTTRQNIIGILKKVPRKPPQQGYSITDGTVIADFYIPYLCCSDCPPVAYITSASAPAQQTKPTITMNTTFCDIDTTAEPITPSAPGGKLSITNAAGGTVNGLDAAKMTFTPSQAGAGTYQITYTLNNVASDPVTVTVLATPHAPAFTFKNKDLKNDDGTLVVEVTFSTTSPNNAYTYKWKFGTGFSETTATGTSVSLTASLNLKKNPKGLKTSVTLTASNGTCTGAVTTKNLEITGNGLELAAVKPEEGGLIKGIEHLFTKKKKGN